MRIALPVLLLALAVGCASSSPTDLATSATQPTTPMPATGLTDSSPSASTHETMDQATTRPTPRTLIEALNRFEIDPRLTICVITEESDALVGVVESPVHRTLLGRWLGKDVSRVRLLPDDSQTPDRFGIVTAEHSILRDGPRDRPGDRDNVTDVLFGEPVWIMDRDADALLVRGRDGYLGWTPADAVWPVGAELFNAYVKQDIRLAHANQIRHTGASSSPSSTLSTTRLSPLLESVRVRDSKSLRTLLTRPDGEVNRARTGMVLNEAHSFLGTRYVWGGKTKNGIDCSGLMQVSFGRQGIVLPRDADQQANVGRLVATRWMRDGLSPGDLLFFESPRRGNIAHVALYLGAGKYIEAAGDNVHVASLNPNDPDYDAKRAATFSHARRVLD